MTEKRYRISDEAHYVYSDIYDGDEPLRNDEVVKLLNEKDKEIKELISELMRYEPVIFNNDGEKLVLYELKEI